ncbi:MAG: glutamate racemase [Alphaproteobacteria bacterium]|jgi:glutamate racemase|nr:glutamate racemase [Alphaproteobacteria bacterium]
MSEPTVSYPSRAGHGGRVLVFDSGVGGLTVAGEIAALAPGLTVDYAADTGFFPYGDKSDAALRERLPRVARALVAAARPDVFVIACNTASTLALPQVRAALEIPVVGTVPAIKPAAAASRSHVIGLLATPGTLSRDYTARLISEFAAHAQIIAHGSLELVRLAEAHAAGDTPPLDAFAAAQGPLFAGPAGAGIDTVVLACTHFPLVRGQLIATAPRPLTYIDSGAAIARQTLRLLPAAATPSGASRAPMAYATRPDAAAPRFARMLARYGYPRVSAVTVSGAAASGSPS